MQKNRNDALNVIKGTVRASKKLFQKETQKEKVSKSEKEKNSSYNLRDQISRESSLNLSNGRIPSEIYLGDCTILNIRTSLIAQQGASLRMRCIRTSQCVHVLLQLLH